MSARILCVGDSLTAGYYGNQSHYTPYATTLGQRLNVTVDQIGRSGWRVDEMVSNMNNPMCVDVFGQSGPGLAVALSAQNYSTVIIMGGTNDLPTAASAGQIAEHLKCLHRECHNRGLRTVALSVPESRFTQSDMQASMKRQQINAGLAQFAAMHADKMMFVDMAALLPYSDVTGEWAQDGLHYSQMGFAKFGAILASQIQGFAHPHGPMTSPRKLSISALSPIASPMSSPGSSPMVTPLGSPVGASSHPGFAAALPAHFPVQRARSPSVSYAPMGPMVMVL